MDESASLPLIVTVIAVAVIGVTLPFTPRARPLGMVPLPASYFVFVALVVPVYLTLVELLKARVLGKIASSSHGERARGSHQIVRRPHVTPPRARRWVH